MNFCQKKRLKQFTPPILGILLALLSIIKPLMILFILPTIIFLYKNKINKNNPIMIFLACFLIIYAPFMYIENISVNEQILATYNLLKNEITDTNLGTTEVIEKSNNLDNFEGKNDFILASKNESAKLTLSKECYEGKQCLKLEIQTPTKSEITLKKEINPSDWNEYGYFNLWIKNKGEFGWLGIVLVDEDGDWWHYDNDQILKKQEWTLLKIPLASLKNYEWTNHGNGRMDKIIEYRFKFKEYPGESKYEVFIDHIHLSKF